MSYFTSLKWGESKFLVLSKHCTGGYYGSSKVTVNDKNNSSELNPKYKIRTLLRMMP